jgi:hypothetical protein
MSNRDGYLNDTGTLISIDLQEDLSTYAVLIIKYKKPDETTGEWPAVLNGLGTVTYTTEYGDLDMVGTWYVQVYVEMTGWRGHSSITSFGVRQHIVV